MLRHTSCAFLRRHKGLTSFAGALAVMAAFYIYAVLFRLQYTKIAGGAAAAGWTGNI